MVLTWCIHWRAHWIPQYQVRSPSYHFCQNSCEPDRLSNLLARPRSCLFLSRPKAAVNVDHEYRSTPVSHCTTLKVGRIIWKLEYKISIARYSGTLTTWWPARQLTCRPRPRPTGPLACRPTQTSQLLQYIQPENLKMAAASQTKPGQPSVLPSPSPSQT
jgi:hypothetical protein